MSFLRKSSLVLLLSIQDVREFKDLFLDIVSANNLGLFFQWAVRGGRKPGLALQPEHRMK